MDSTAFQNSSRGVKYWMEQMETGLHKSGFVSLLLSCGNWFCQFLCGPLSSPFACWGWGCRTFINVSSLILGLNIFCLFVLKVLLYCWMASCFSFCFHWVYSQMRTGWGGCDWNAEAVSQTTLHAGDQSFHSLFSFQNKAAFMRSPKISSQFKPIIPRDYSRTTSFIIWDCYTNIPENAAWFSHCSFTLENLPFL